MGNKDKAAFYQKIAESIRQVVPATFLDKTECCVLYRKKRAARCVSNCISCVLGILDKKQLETASAFLASAFKKGTLSYKGSVRHVLTDQDFDAETAWESATVPKNTYQNGSYWRRRWAVLHC